MPDRSYLNVYNGTSYATLMTDDQSFQGSWSNPNVPLLIFKDNSLPGTSVDYHGGPVSSGTPVELLFWGDWWNSDEGVARRNLYVTRAQGLLASDYFSELVQYGVAKPTWRGARVVTNPEPLAAFNSNDDVQSVPDLIDTLVDDNVFPDPDDEKIAFVVFMAKGFTQSIGQNGSHTDDYTSDFPWVSEVLGAKGWFWVAWVRFFGNPGATGGDEDPESAMRTCSHELVEMLTDPELDGWYAGSVSGEIADAGVTPTTGTKQTAWVNGVQVQAYWSNRHGATVIPIDRDYKARIVGTIHSDRRVSETGTYRPDAGDSKLCNLSPKCCLEQREYRYTMVKQDETVQLHVETGRYRQPQFMWSIEGTPVSKSTTLSLSVIAGTFDGHIPKFGPQTVKVACTPANNQLTLTTTGTGANFDIQVSCAVTDASIAGNLTTNAIATPAVTVGFVGVEVADDPEYQKQKDACNQALRDMFQKLGVGKSTKGKIGDPVQFGRAILRDLPAYTRVQAYGNAKQVVELSRMVNAFLPKDSAGPVIDALVKGTPALQAALARQQPDGDVGLQLNVVTADGAPFRGTVDIECKHQTLSDHRNFRNVDASDTIAIRGLMRAPQGLYEVTVTPTTVFKPVSQFVDIPASGSISAEFRVGVNSR
jgi:hypothetical protein